MKTVKIKSVAVEFPINTTKIGLEIVEINGSITRTTDHLSIDIPGLYPHMNTELFNIVLRELNNAGYDVMTTETVDQAMSPDIGPVGVNVPPGG